jgi:hypothetical protein
MKRDSRRSLPGGVVASPPKLVYRFCRLVQAWPACQRGAAFLRELSLQARKFKSNSLSKTAGLSLLVAAAAVSGCNSSKTFAGLKPGETLTQGYVVDQESLDWRLSVPAASRCCWRSAAVHHRDLRQRGVLLHLADAPASRGFHERQAGRPAHSGRLFQR